MRGRGRGNCSGRMGHNDGGAGQFRMTGAREVVLSVLKKGAKLLKADDVYSEAKKLYPGIGMATIYRALDILSENGIIGKKDFGDGSRRYEYTEENKSTSCHIVCESCGKIIRYDELSKEEKEFIDNMGKTLMGKVGFNARSSEIRLNGICENCK
ncbi:MAG: transcriptional repressor [Candidatus Omnitrophica bacterium]|nr:transcriptional repressor [Candidatus Omnitrophota bacterium]